MANEQLNNGHNQQSEKELQGINGFYNDLMSLHMHPQDPQLLDGQIAQRAETYLQQAPETIDPTFAQVINTLAAGAMRTHEARTIASRVFAQQKYPNSIDVDAGNRFSSLLQGSIESREYEGGNEALSAECASIVQKWCPEILDSTNNLTSEQRRGMALTVLFASQAAEVQSGVAGTVQQNLPKIVEAIR